MFRKLHILASATLVVTIAFSPIVRAQSSDTDRLQAEVTALKAQVAQLRKDLDEVTNLAPIQSLLKENRPVNVTINVEGKQSAGALDAALTIIEFSDFQCPYCGRHATATYPALKQQYVDTGALKYVFADFPLGNHKLAPMAAQAAHCAGEQDLFWEMHGVLFANQKALQPEQLAEHAEVVGLDVSVWQMCVDSDKYASVIAEGLASGAKIGVKGTPSFGLGYTTDGGKSVQVVKVLRGALPIEQFQAAIDELTASGSN